MPDRHSVSEHQIYISVGSNIERETHTQKGLDALFNEFGALTLSRVFESEAIGFKGDTFYNLVVGATTTRTVSQVCQCLKDIEHENGRVRGAEKFSSRTLDLDLLLYDKLVIDNPVELPRGEILYNAFVLQPLADIAPIEKHPIVDETYASLWQAFDKQTQRLWPIPFAWSPPAA
ncbi:2-amino-4-hydroxy-6-hydroxymethyldihydropteridine diphosphokinase [Aestuariibacter salexigens]|uniref:2-amino-4-hydroxy-6- hydroxymethyldihydropteridine diphosphokinase n=1 Tax=Aestuariibacter salexigens TaxID=226010 RepID=UPI00040B522D|nr:2-amino-4-hydroxy-6-hydroxymethyldihydropteridine diphosphokinase [Aestuariibacter salexigens]